MKYLIITLIFVPTIASAMWWNPTTWFDKQEVVEIPQVTSQIAPEVVTEYKTEYKTEYVTNTDEINALYSQIAVLNQTIATLEAEKSSLTLSNNECTDKEAERQSLLSQIAVIETRIAEIDFEIRDYPNVTCCVSVMPMYLQTPLLNERAELELDLVLLYNDLNTL